MILFHLLVEGEATARIPGQRSVALEAGDIAVLPRGDAHAAFNRAFKREFDLPPARYRSQRRTGAQASAR